MCVCERVIITAITSLSLIDFHLEERSVCVSVCLVSLIEVRVCLMALIEVSVCVQLNMFFLNSHYCHTCAGLKTT